MIGTIVNTAAVALGGSVGLLFKKNIPEKIQTIYFQTVGLFTLSIGISMVWQMKHILIIVFSLIIGSVIGELLSIEERSISIGAYLKKKLKIGNERFTEGLTTSFLLFCMGSMSIVGSIEDGLNNQPDLLLTKSIMDGFSALLLASAFGIGVAFSAIPLFIFQSSITVVARFAGSFLTSEMIQGISVVGGILLIGLAINILEIKRLKIMNMLPAVIIVVLLIWGNSFIQTLNL